MCISLNEMDVAASYPPRWLHFKRNYPKRQICDVGEKTDYPQQGLTSQGGEGEEPLGVAAHGLDHTLPAGLPGSLLHRWIQVPVLQEPPWFIVLHGCA